jgi:error-prone DNA polymerase
MGLRYVRGMRADAGQALVGERQRRLFTSVDDLRQRVPELTKSDMVMLAQIGALNSISKNSTPELDSHRRHALWNVDRVAQPAGPLLEPLPENDPSSPLARMTPEERLVADFHGTGLTVGPHPMAYRREQMQRLNVLRAIDLKNVADGKRVRVAGSVIARQRPGTAHGFIFLSLEDETGIANIIVRPDLYDEDRLILIRERFLLVEGIMQNQENVLSIKAERLRPVNISAAEMQSHDFH